MGLESQSRQFAALSGRMFAAGKKSPVSAHKKVTELLNGIADNVNKHWDEDSEVALDHHVAMAAIHRHLSSLNRKVGNGEAAAHHAKEADECHNTATEIERFLRSGQ